MNTHPDSHRSETAAEAGPMPPDLEIIVAEHPFLKGLSPKNIKLLTSCAMLTAYKPGEFIFREGDPANRFYLIRSGAVSIDCPLPEGGSTPIHTVGPGEVLGWSWLFPPYYWHFEARALEKTEAIFFYGTPLREECDKDHDFGYELMRRVSEIMMERLQSTRFHLVKVEDHH